MKSWTPEQAAGEAPKKRSALGAGPVEDLAALQNFAQDMRPGNRQQGVRAENAANERSGKPMNRELTLSWA